MICDVPSEKFSLITRHPPALDELAQILTYVWHSRPQQCHHDKGHSFRRSYSKDYDFQLAKEQSLCKCLSFDAALRRFDMF